MLRNLLLILSFLILTSCGESDIFSNPKEVTYVKDPLNPARMVTEKQAKRIGALDINFLKKDDKPDGYQDKNYFLWSACVDILSDLPPKISDAAGGIYMTEYVQSKDGSKQAIQCRILGEKVLSTNVNITVFTISTHGKQLKPYENNEIKSNVLIRARELKAQYDEKV